MAFPWLEKENSTYTAALNKVTEERRDAAFAEKARRIAEDRAEDARIERERESMAALAASEATAQRKRAEDVARREAAAAAQQLATRDDKIEAFRQIRAREVLSKHAPPPVSSPWKGLHHTVQLGGDGLSPKPVFQRSARGLAPVDAAARRDKDEATLEAAVAGGNARPDQVAALSAAEIRKRALGGSRPF
mmetsp:Transcript_47755/g.153816  ORF Transcript_47755/g.153816 Transcript_47755/m.153816 type:complete len:191 (-) Transcript_47755:312-884(-)